LSCLKKRKERNRKQDRKERKEKKRKHDRKQRKEKREESVDEEALVKTALSYVSLNDV